MEYFNKIGELIISNTLYKDRILNCFEDSKFSFIDSGCQLSKGYVFEIIEKISGDDLREEIK